MSYTSLVVPRRTKCPPVFRAHSVCPNRVWFDPERALNADTFRKQYPLHYHLSKYDAAAVWATVKAGADPAKRDAAGRTVLDLAVEMTLELLETCFCTSTILENVDNPPTMLSTSNALCPQRPSELVLTNPHVATYKDACNNLYVHSDRMRYEMKSKAPTAGFQQQRPSLSRPPEEAESLFKKKRYLPVFRTQRYKEPEVFLDERRDVCSFPLPEEDILSCDSFSRRDRPQQFLYAFNEQGRPSALQQLERDQARLEQRRLHQSLLVVANGFFQYPPSKGAIAQMRELIRRLNLLLTVVERFSASAALRRAAEEKAGDQLDRHITYPYLYIATMYQLFKGYPKALNGEAWEVLNPADSRRLVLTIQSLGLRGHEILSFLGTVCRLFDKLLSALHILDTHKRNNGRGGCLSGECCQYYLHMAFTLDDIGLFRKLVFAAGLYGRRDIFRWEDLLYALIESPERVRDFLGPLLVKRLKTRVQRRLVSDGDRKAEIMEESVKYPFEERYLTRRLLEEYGDMFGPQEAKELSAMLRNWRYGAARAIPS